MDAAPSCSQPHLGQVKEFRRPVDLEKLALIWENDPGGQSPARGDLGSGARILQSKEQNFW
jgi:hypothetical protein